MIDPFRSKVSINLKKAAGQLRHIEKMIEEDRYCVEVAQQVNAAIGILRQTNALVLENHLHTCGGHKLSSKNKKERDDFIQELIQSFTLTSK